MTGKDFIEISGNHKSPFEQIKQSEEGNEYWMSRDLAALLGYQDYRNFEKVIEKAKKSCINSNHDTLDHFVEVNEMVPLGSGAQRALQSVALSRYACYLIIQNADPTKELVALGQTYFAVQTRKQELAELGIEEERRLMLREEIKRHNKKLAGVAKNAGVIEPRDYAIFQNHGYQGLYGGLTMLDIHKKKHLLKSQKILDHMGSTELAANLFRATQTEEKLRRENITNKEEANKTHREVGAKIRKTIHELGGTMPEELPTADSIKKIERKKKALEKKTKAIKKPEIK